MCALASAHRSALMPKKFSKTIHLTARTASETSLRAMEATSSRMESPSATLIRARASRLTWI